MVWVSLILEVISLIFKYGPTIVQLVMDIIALIKKQPIPAQAGYRADLLAACKLMNSDKMMGANALSALKAKLQAA